MIVTTPLQADWMALRVEEAGGAPAVEARLRILPWSAFVAEALRGDGQDRPLPVSRSFQRILLASLVPATIRRDDYFGAMLTAPGFVSSLQERLREWKLAGGAPEHFADAARRAADAGMPQLGRKLGDVERLYASYERMLRENGLCDDEDGVWRAVNWMSTEGAPIPFHAERIVVHGFYRFTLAQRRLLQALAARGGDFGGREPTLTVTLPWDADRRLLFAAPGRTRAQFQAEFVVREVRLPAGAASERAVPLSLNRLNLRLFPAPDAIDNATPLAADGALSIIDAPNPYVETELVAREFVRLRAASKAPWSDFAIILRSTADYAPILAAVFERCGIPVAAAEQETCAQNALIRTVLRLIDVVLFGWRHDDVLAFLKSSYTWADPLEVDGLRKRALAMGVRDGRDAWLSLVDAASPATRPAPAADLPAILAAMARFDTALRDERMEAAQFAAAVREIVTAFGMEARIDAGARNRRDGDLAALREALEALDGIVRLARIRADGPIGLREFRDGLVEAWTNAIARPEAADDAVRVLEPFASRERPMRFAAIMGLTERVFPRRITEDPFLRDDERRLLRDWTSLALEEQRLRAEDERFLFYLAATAPSEVLLLSFPRSARESDTLPSFYLDEVRALFGARASDTEPGVDDSDDRGAAPIRAIVRTLADVAPRPDEAVNEGDRLLSACADLLEPPGQGADRRARALSAARLLRRLLDTEGAAGRARSVLVSRGLPRLPALRATDLLARFADARPVFSVAELETYGRCPFRYLLQFVWRLSAEKDGLDPGRQSALLHHVLRRYFRGKRRSGSASLRTADPAEVFAELNGLLQASLEGARLAGGPHRVRMLLRRLEDDLMGFSVREVRCAEQFGASPAHFHLTFGKSRGAITPDPGSCADPLVIEGPGEQGSVSIAGTIDRVDWTADGAAAIVVEYETARPPEFAAIQRGESLHATIGMIALERLFGMPAGAVCYDSMQEAGRRRFHRTEHVNVRTFAPALPFDDPGNVKPLSREQYADLVATAEVTVLKAAQSIASGRVEATPGSHCRGCDYRDVCRTTAIDGHDGER